MTRVLGIVIVGVLAQAQSGVVPRDMIAPAMARISGQIKEQGSGDPVPRAIVMLVKAGSSEQLEAVVADGDGRYEFKNVQAGRYILWAGPGELRATHLRHAFGQSEPADIYTGLPRPNIELRAGQVVAGADIALMRALAIEGRVLDPSGEPVAGAEVRLQHASGGGGNQSESDDRGAFRFFGLSPGRYRVCAAAITRYDEMAPLDDSRLVRTCHPASIGIVGASEVVLAAADATGIDIRMQRIRTYSMSGIVLDAAGAPARNAWVAARRLEEDGTGGHTETGEAGFTLGRVTPGKYLVYATFKGPPMGYPDKPAPDKEVGYEWVEVGGSDVTGVTIQLSKAETLGGRVIFEGTPAPRANSLQLVVQTGTRSTVTWFLSRPPFAAVDDNLTFTLTGLYRMPFVVGIGGLPTGWVLKSVRYDGRDITGVATDLANPALPRRIDVVLTNRVARASVRVTDDRGEPVTSYRIALLPADPARWNEANWFVQGVPSPEGIVKLGELLPGDYLLAALTSVDASTLFQEREGRMGALASITTPVRLVEGENPTVELRLKPLPPLPH